MTKIEKSLDSIKNEFSIFFDAKDKYIYLIEIGKENSGLSENDKNTKTKIEGCTSQAWIVIKESKNSFNFFTDSDAMIVRGLLSLIGRVFNGLTKEEILSIDPNIFLNKIGLDAVVSSQRTNGFGQALHKIHNKLKN